MIFKVGIIGPESTGKSTLAQDLAQRYHGIYISERARTYVEQKGSVEVSWDELCEIARLQIREMEEIEKHKEDKEEYIYFFDTELIITKVWFDYAFGRVPEWLEEAIRRLPMDIYLLTAPDIPWIPDPARSNGSDEIRQELFERYESEIQALEIPYYIISH